MAQANVRGVLLEYQVLGERGPWVTLSPGGRRGMEGVVPLARRVADAGYRVLVHDRRNCGASQIAIAGDESEYEIWADDLYELLRQLDALPVYAGGSSSGCRLALLLALRHPEAVRGLLLWRVTGGELACNRLAGEYYGQFLDAARLGGMPAVAEMEHWRERIAEDPANRERLLSMDPNEFIRVMDHWRDYFVKSADLPVIGATEDALRSIRVPACVVPGNDQTHPRPVADNLRRLLPEAELHDVMTETLDVPLGPIEDWQAKEAELAAVFVGFLNRVCAPATA